VRSMDASTAAEPACYTIWFVILCFQVNTHMQIRIARSRRSGVFFVQSAPGLPLLRSGNLFRVAAGTMKGAHALDISFLWRGLLIGFSIAAVVGPIGILCIQRSLRQGFVTGLVTGLGAATADGIYGGIAAFSLTVIARFLIGQESWVRLLGGLFLLYLGLKALLSKPAEQAARAGGRSLPGLYASTLLLTLTNPLTILSFATVFAGLGVGTNGQHGFAAATLVTLGVFSGSSCWWLLLSGGVSLLREKLTAHWLSWLNRLAGAALLIFGIIALISLIP
jgi:threonine/homoserine/homoserine lactone efflux protein